MDDESQGGARFSTTQWNLVLSTRREDAADRPEALNRICQQYRQAVFEHVRDWGYSSDQANDLTQDFFAKLLRTNSFASADPNRGRFRSFLLGALKHFLLNYKAAQQTFKRGRGFQIVSLDEMRVPQADREEPEDISDSSLIPPDLVFDRRWAESMIETVLNSLRREILAHGSPARYQLFKTYLLNIREPSPSEEESRAAGFLTVGGAKSFIYRMRERFRDLFRAELAGTLSDPAGIDDEMRHLHESLRL